MADHEILIEQLGRSVHPVKRPWPMGWRVMAWVAMALPSGAAASLLLHRALTDWSESGAPWVALQLIITFITGTLAIRNAFQLSIAGRRPLGWKWFAPLIFVWLGTTLVNMRHQTFSLNNADSTHCYVFMIVVSVPMVALVIAYLRRTRTLFPIQSLAAAGAGVACMALTLLSLCHAPHISWPDFLMHTAAIATIVTTTVFLGYRWVSLR